MTMIDAGMKNHRLAKVAGENGTVDLQITSQTGKDGEGFVRLTLEDAVKLAGALSSYIDREVTRLGIEPAALQQPPNPSSLMVSLLGAWFQTERQKWESMDVRQRFLHRFAPGSCSNVIPKQVLDAMRYCYDFPHLVPDVGIGLKRFLEHAFGTKSADAGSPEPWWPSLGNLGENQNGKEGVTK